MARTNDSDVFLSYRRANREFALQLDEALRAQGLEVWIDTEDILPGVDHFGTEIEDGILGADIFVPVFSPDFFESKYCMHEMNFAIENGKRVIPIIYKPLTDFSKIPSQAGEVNWIYFCPFHEMQNTFEEAFPNLMDAIHLDEDYIKSHTEYLRRAKLWEEKERHDDFLLSGEEVAIAYQWLTTPTTGNHQVIPLQQEFIQKSNQLQEKVVAEQLETERKLARRQRNFFIVTYGGLLALMIGIVLIGNAVIDQAGEQVQSMMLPMLEVAQEQIDTDVLSELALAHQNDDQALIQELSERHRDDLEAIEAIYPFANTYTLLPDNSDDVPILLGQSDELVTTEESFYSGSLMTEFVEPDVYYDDITTDGFVDLIWAKAVVNMEDESGNYLATLVIEQQDPIGYTENVLALATGLIFFVFIGIIIFYLIAFARNTIRKLFKRDKTSASNPDKATLQPTTS